MDKVFIEFLQKQGIPFKNEKGQKNYLEVATNLDFA
jgi:hypothetical protein